MTRFRYAKTSSSLFPAVRSDEMSRGFRQRHKVDYEVCMMHIYSGQRTQRKNTAGSVHVNEEKDLNESSMQ